MATKHPLRGLQCKARSKRSQQQCRKIAIPGGDVCYMHGGASQRPKAEQRLAEYDTRRKLERMGIHVETTADEALIHQLWEAAGNVAYLRSRVQQLGEAPGAGEAIVGPDHNGDLAPHVLLKLYNEERDRLARLAKAALDVGVSRRHVEIAERQGAMIVDVILAVVNDPRLGLDEERRRVAREIAGKHLRLIDSEEVES